MSTLVITDAKVLVGGYNLSAFHSSCEMTYEVEILDDTTFGTSGTRSAKPGLKTFSFTGNMFWDTAVDEMLFNRIGATPAVMSIAPVGNTEGDRSYCLKGVGATYSPASGEVGALMRTNLDARAAGTPLVRGQLMATGAKAATGTGSGGLYGAAAIGKRIYSALHVTAIAGTAVPTFTGIIESDDAVGFTSPTTQLTHTAMTAIGADWKEASSGVGGITDTYWRASWTISGTNPSFTVYWTFGIL
jgi:hypothetical protein